MSAFIPASSTNGLCHPPPPTHPPPNSNSLKRVYVSRSSDFSSISCPCLFVVHTRRLPPPPSSRRGNSPPGSGRCTGWLPARRPATGDACHTPGELRPGRLGRAGQRGRRGRGLGRKRRWERHAPEGPGRLVAEGPTGSVQQEWSSRSGQTGVVKQEWSNRSGPTGVVRRNGLPGSVKQKW